VSEATRTRIEALLTQRGYVRTWEIDAGRPRQILAVFRDLASPYTLEIVRGIVESAADMGVHTTVGTTSRRSIGQWLEECPKLGALGVVVVISTLTEQDQRRVVDQQLPVVLIDPLNAPSSNIPSIGATNWHGATTAVQHLIGLGHRRIACSPAAHTPWPGRRACTVTVPPSPRPESRTMPGSYGRRTSTTARR
jgi:LacI family transcriptional regulator/LacI family xylobiose transport system transcriptional regulator